MTGIKALSLVEMVCANYLSARIDKKATIALWLDIFRHEPDEIMEIAVRMCLTSYRTPPTIAEIKQAIHEWHQESSMSTGAATKQLNPRSRQTSPFADKVFAAIHSGQAKQFMDNFYNKDVFEWIKGKLPDISDDSIRKNYAAVAEAYESVARCLGCQWRDGKCSTNGFYAVPRMESNGFIKNEMALCGKRTLAI